MRLQQIWPPLDYSATRARVEELILPGTVMSDLIDETPFELALNDHITFSQRESGIFHAKGVNE